MEKMFLNRMLLWVTVLYADVDLFLIHCLVLAQLDWSILLPLFYIVAFLQFFELFDV